MKAIIPAKANSTRVANKNYRDFYCGKSLVDLLVEKLLRVLPPGDIYLSCEDATKREVAEWHGIQFHLRDLRLADNDTPFPDVVRGISAAVAPGEDVLWCECIDPLFDGHAACLQQWREMRWGCDSLVVVYPMRQYLLDAEHRPMNFGFGMWHVKSQRLPNFYRINFTCSILSPECVSRYGVVGVRPIWFAATNTFLDIDTEWDFQAAQAVYFAFQPGGPEKP